MLVRLAIGIGIAVAVLIRIANDHHWDPSTLGSWFGAVGSLTAATCALGIATRDRHDRERERSSAAQAQARLLCVSRAELDDKSAVRLSVVNYGREPVMEVLIFYRDSQRDHIAPPQPWDWKIADKMCQVLAPATTGVNEKAAVVNTWTADIPIDPPDSIHHLLVLLEFRDANGVKWMTVHNAVRQIEDPARIDVDSPHSFLERLFTSRGLFFGYYSPWGRTVLQPTLRWWNRFRNRLSVVLWGTVGGKARIRRRIHRKMRRRMYAFYVAGPKRRFALGSRKSYLYRLNHYLRTGQWPR
jgi:hypothetical protein